MNSINFSLILSIISQIVQLQKSQKYQLTTMTDASKMNNRIIILSVFFPISSCSHKPGIGISANVITSLSDVDDVTIGFGSLIEPFNTSGVCSSSMVGELNDVLRTQPRLSVSCVTDGAVPYVVLAEWFILDAEKERMVLQTKQAVTQLGFRIEEGACLANICLANFTSIKEKNCLQSMN